MSIVFDEAKVDNSVNTVHVTNEHDKFKFNDKNRSVNPAHVDKLRASIQENNLLSCQPILVNRDFEIIDGQHRFTVAKELEEPVYYIMEEGLSIDDAITLNINTKNWSWQDYLQYWIDQGNKHYEYFKSFMQQYDFGYSVSLALLGLGQADAGQKLSDFFNEGRFKPKYKEYGVDIGNKTKEMYQHGAFVTNRSFVLAFDEALNMEEYDHETFMNKLEMVPDRFTKCSTKENYLRMMEDVINYNKHGGRTRLY